MGRIDGRVPPSPAIAPIWGGPGRGNELIAGNLRLHVRLVRAYLAVAPPLDCLGFNRTPDPRRRRTEIAFHPDPEVFE